MTGTGRPDVSEGQSGRSAGRVSRGLVSVLWLLFELWFIGRQQATVCPASARRGRRDVRVLPGDTGHGHKQPGSWLDASTGLVLGNLK